MAIVRIPLDSEFPYFAQAVELNGEQFRLEFEWNIRDARWYMSIFDADGVTIVDDIAMVISWPLTRRFAVPNLPNGEFWLLDVNGSEEEAGVWDLGDRAVLYFEDAE